MKRARASRVGALAALTLAALGTSGCGMSRIAGGDLPEPWPIKPLVEADPQGVRLAEDPRPTLLLRLALDEETIADLAEEDADVRRDVDLAPYRAALDSGLFRGVTYQLGTEGYAVEADYTLDLAIRSDFEGGWYTILGVVTFGGLPIVGFDEYSVAAVARGHDRRVLGQVREGDDETIVLWVPFLPLNMVSPVLPDFGLTTLAGLNPTRWGDERDEMLYALVARLLARAHDRFGFEVETS